MSKKEKEKIVYRPYLLKKIMVVNGWEFNEIIISSHYEKEHGSYMSDEKILKIAKKLDKKSGFIPKLHGKLPNSQQEWQSFFWEPFRYQDKAYRLVWYWEIGNPRLWILHCHRRKKYEKK